MQKRNCPTGFYLQIEIQNEIKMSISKKRKFLEKYFWGIIKKYDQVKEYETSPGPSIWDTDIDMFIEDPVKMLKDRCAYVHEECINEIIKGIFIFRAKGNGKIE